MDDENFNDPKIALQWIQVVESDSAKVRERDLYPILREWIEHHSPAVVLDIGCGQGVCSDKISLMNNRYIGLEPSPALVDRARTRYAQSGREFVVGNIYNMPFADASFDSAFSVSVWHLLSDLRKASIELMRVLKPAGQFLIITANPEAYSLWTSAYSEVTQEGVRLNGIVRRNGEVVSQDTLFLHPLEEILAALNSSGLSVDQIENFRPGPSGEHQYICLKGKKAGFRPKIPS